MTYRPDPSGDFARQIAAEVARGSSFAFLLGAGVSAPAGIPVTAALRGYLHRCIDRALYAPPGSRPWSPREQAWPPLDSNDGLPPPNFVETVIRRLLERPTIQDTPAMLPECVAPAAIYQEAYGAQGDWRTALHFLSRVEQLRANTPPAVTLGSPDNDVIDSFFLHIVATKSPTLEHHLIVMLADLLRVNTLVTTNFDTLIEEAFDLHGETLTLFDVHQAASFPPAALAARQRSLIKIHGGRYGLRADFTLDKRRSLDDHLRFASYLLNAEVREIDTLEQLIGAGVVPSHLFIAGLGGNDRDVQSLVEFALRRMPSMRCFLVCYTSADLARWGKLCKQYPTQFTTIRHTQLGLLLLEVYQVVAGSLPPSSIAFPAIWHTPIPPNPYGPNARNDDEVKLFNNEIIRLRQVTHDLIDPRLDEGASNTERFCLVMSSKKGIYGVPALATHIFEELTETNNCLWLELDHVASVDELFLGLYEIICRRRGIHDPLPFPLPAIAREELWRRTFTRLLGGTDGRWIFFINARETAGANTGSSHSDRLLGKTSPPRGWGYRAPDGARFWTLLHALAGAGDPIGSTPRRRHAHAIVLAYDDDPDTIALSPQSAPKDECVIFALKESCVQFSSEEVVRRTVDWLRSAVGEPYRAKATRFTYALTLFHRARYQAALKTWAVFRIEPSMGPDQDDERARRADDFLQYLEAFGTVKRKQGGFVWMHHTVRESLRLNLEAEFPELRPMAAELHESIADWYERLFLASGDPLAIIESIDHRIQCAHMAGQHRSEAGTEDPRVVSAAVQALNAVRFGRESLLSRGHGLVLIRKLKRLVRLAPRASAWCDFRSQCRDVLVLLLRLVGDLKEVYTKATYWTPARSDGGPSEIGGHTGVAQGDEMHRAQLYGQGIIALRGRAFEIAVAKMTELWGALGLPQPGAAPSLTAYRAKLAEWSASNRSAAIEALRLSRRRMQLLIMQAHVERLNWRRGDPDEWSWQKRLLELVWIYYAAREIMRLVGDPAGIQKEQFWARTQLAAGLGMLGCVSEARRRLNEAEGHLSGTDRRRGYLWGVLEIRRAELSLELARQLPGFEVRRKLIGAIVDGREVASLTPWLERGRALAFAEDASRHLGVARQHLSRSRRTIWWWTLWLELRMKSFEVNLVATADQADRPAQGSGLVPMTPGGRLDREVDAVLEDTLRLALDDAFRLARVLQSYLTCATALLVRALQPEGGASLRKDVQQFVERARDANATLGRVYSRRIDVAQLPLADSVKAWLDHTRSRNEHWIEALSVGSTTWK